MFPDLVNIKSDGQETELPAQASMGQSIVAKKRNKRMNMTIENKPKMQYKEIIDSLTVLNALRKPKIFVNGKMTSLRKSLAKSFIKAEQRPSRQRRVGLKSESRRFQRSIDVPQDSIFESQMGQPNKYDSMR